MTYDSFDYELDGGIATIRLNNPGQLNALTFRTYEELAELTGSLAEDPGVHVVVLTGAGRGFCSGGSVDGIIGELLKMDSAGLYRFTRLTCDVVRNMRLLQKPVIAAVNGIAAGAGAALALAGDFRILSDRARMAFLFVKVGLAGSDMGAIHLLPRIVGMGRAMELLTLGDTIDAAEAHRIGLANKVVPHDELMPEVLRLARRLRDGAAVRHRRHEAAPGPGSGDGSRGGPGDGGHDTGPLHANGGLSRRLSRVHGAGSAPVQPGPGVGRRWGCTKGCRRRNRVCGGG